MKVERKASKQTNKEHIAEVLKERIYATLALLAVLISIDTVHYSPLKAGYLITGTIVALWAASIVATVISRRIVFSGEINHEKDRDVQLRKHAAILASLPFPLLMILLAWLSIISLSVAINIAIISVLLLMMTWSVLSAKSLNFKSVPIILLVLIGSWAGCRRLQSINWSLE